MRNGFKYLILILLVACQKKAVDLCTHFDREGVHVTIGKLLNDQQKQIIYKIIDESISEFRQIDAEIGMLNAAHMHTYFPLSPAVQDLLSLYHRIATLSGRKTDIEIHNGIFQKNSSEFFDLPAKGLCIDRIVDRLNSTGFGDLIVECGGEFRATGHHPENRDWSVLIDPRFKKDDKPLAPIPLRDCAIATVRNDQSIAFATVIASSCALADAFAKATILFPDRKSAEAWAQEIVEYYPDVSFWILSHR